MHCNANNVILSFTISYKGARRIRDRLGTVISTFPRHLAQRASLNLLPRIKPTRARGVAQSIKSRCGRTSSSEFRSSHGSQSSEGFPFGRGSLGWPPSGSNCSVEPNASHQNRQNNPIFTQPAMATAVATPPTTEGPVPPALAHIPLPETRKNTIFFFSPEGPHGLLSNFAASAFKINGVSWRTVEHYYHVRPIQRHLSGSIGIEGWNSHFSDRIPNAWPGWTQNLVSCLTPFFLSLPC